MQHFDGTIEGLEMEIWRDIDLEPAQAPEDWSGSVDMDPDDYVGRGANEMPPGFHDPMEFFDKPK